MKSAEDFHWHRREHNASGQAGLAILTPLLLIAVSECVTWLDSRATNELGLETRDDANVESFVLTTGVVWKQDVCGTLTVCNR